MKIKSKKNTNTYRVAYIPFCPATVEIEATSAEEARKYMENNPRCAEVLDVEEPESEE
jgi:hypothetical protein